MARNGLPVRIIVRQPIGIDKMCLKEMQTISEKIHHMYKIAVEPPTSVCNSDSRIIT